MKYLTQWLMSILFFWFPLCVFAQSEPPQHMTVDGRFYEAGSSTEPLLDPIVNIRIQVLNPAKSCILYEEQQSVSTLSTSGYFNIQVGSIVGDPKRTSLDSLNTMKDVFYNRTTAITGKTSVGGGCSYTPTAMEARYFRFLITPSTVGTTSQLSPDMLIDSVPQAIVAQTLQGLGPSDVFRTSATSTQAKLDNLLTTSYSSITDLIAGTSTQYLHNNANGTQLPSPPVDPGTLAEGQVWYNSTSNQIKFYDGSTIQTLGVAGSGITSLTAGSGLDGGTITTTGTISISTGGVTNAMLATGIDASKITLNTLPAGVVPSGTDSTKLPLAGGTLTGALTLGASTNFANFDLLNLGHVTMTNQRTFRFGQFDNAQQATLLGTPLTAGQAGTTWYNTDTGKLMYWNGTQSREVADTTTAGGDITAVSTNAGSGLSGGAITGPVSLQVETDNTGVEINGSNQLQLKDLGVTNAKLAANSVTSAKIVDATIATADLADSSITNQKINTVSPTKIVAGPAEYLTYQPAASACTNGQTLKWNGLTGWECGNDDNAGGDVTAVNTTFPLSGGATSGAISLSLLYDDSTIGINGSNQLIVKSSGITASQLATDAVTTTKILDSNVTTSKIANDAITTAKILNNNVTNAKIVSVGVEKITSSATNYFTYAPNNVVCANGEVLKKTVNGWECGTDIDTNTDAVSSVFTRTGAVTAQSGDYTATQITNTASGNIAAVTAQAALNELDSEKVAKAGDTVSGALILNGTLTTNAAVTATSSVTLNAQNEVRFADSDSSNYVALRL
ncbi:hypothetical protein K2X05_02405 [bacterium]|nr:hypothetical protein [bacterium]